MWIVRTILEVIQQPSHPTPGIHQPQGGGVLGWNGDTPSLIPPGSALSPWIRLQKAQTVRYSMGHRGNPMLNSPFQSAFAEVRSVGTVEKIDSYFQKYQMGHYLYQASAVMSHHTPPPGSTIPVVRSDPQDSGIEDVVDTMPSSSRDRGQQFTKNKLSDQELMVYKHALLCAQFPVLGSRLPRSALPSPSNVSSPHGGRGGASLLTSPPPSPGSLSLDGGGDEGDSMVQEETLCVLVKEAFGLSEERHLFYDDYINRGLGNKPPAKHLVEELMGRLSLLQTNSHPFYQPQDFETRNAYDLWQQQEGQRISALINRFWKGPLPNLDPLVCRASYWSNMHDMYQDLMVLLLKHDKVLKAGPSTGCPLLSSSRRLLREFHLQYGIGEVFRRVVYLEHLSNKEWFESDDWFLKHISQSVLGLQDLLTKHQARVTMVRREYELLCRALTQLQERCCEMLEKLLQERTPQPRVVCLITNLYDILALSAILLSRHQGNLEAIIIQSLKESVQNSYNGHKLRLTTELRLNAYSSPVSAELISKLIVHIQSEIQYIQENYQQLFQLYHVEIIESAASTFYSCLMADVSVLCDKIHVGQQKQEQMIESVDPEMVAMARRLDRLDQAWKSYIPATAQQWRKSLTKSAVHWFQYLIRDVQAMIVYSICRDKFEAVHLTFAQDEGGSHSSYSSNHRPSNANPLTQSIGSAFASVIPKEQQRSKKGASNNNNTIRPKATTHPRHPDVSFNPSGVLNFKRPVRTQSFPQINDLLDRSEQWSAARKSGNEGLVGATRRPEDGASVPGGGGDAFQDGVSGAFEPVILRRETRGSSMNSNVSHQQLTHSQSFPELSSAAAAPGDIPGPSGVQDMVLPLPHDTFHDDYTSGKDQSTSTSRSRSNSSQHHSDRTYTSDAEASTETSSSGVTLSRRRRREQLRAVFEQLGLFSGEGLRQSEITLPISSSLVDMVYVVRHACSLMDDICSVLKPEMSAEMEEDELQQRLLAADLQQLFISPLQGVTFAIRLFASNMLAMDLCATPVPAVSNMISKEVLNRVFIAQSAGLLGACRHERSGIADCNIYLHRNKACLCDNFEPINPEMCLRINNVQGLIELLPDLLADLDGKIAARSSSSSSSSSQTQDTEGTKKQRPLQRYLHSLIVGQIKLLAFKVNQMLSEALGVLLQLDMGSYRIADRLHPLTACIHNHLVATSSWLYPQCYQVFCQELWKSIVKDFEKLVEELLMEKTEDRQRAMLLLQAIAHLMETVTNHSEHGLSADVFLEPADGVIQVLQLYTWPTSRLIELYQGLLQKAWEGTTTDSWPVRRQTLRMLQRLLCQQRKCFTGNELLHALVHCHAEESPAENIWEWAYNTSEQLLRCGLVRRMMASGHTANPTSPEGQGGQNLHLASQGEISDFEGYSFPEVTLHSIPKTSRRNTATYPTTTGEDTDGISDELSRRLRMIDNGRWSREMEDSKSSDEGEAGDGEVQHLEVLAEVYNSPSPFRPVRKEQPLIPSEPACQSTDEMDSSPSADVTVEPVASEVQSVRPSESISHAMGDVPVEDACHGPSTDVTVKPGESEVQSVMPPESASQPRDDHDDGSEGPSADVTNEMVASEESSRDHPVTKDTEGEHSGLTMQTASEDMHQSNVDSKGDGTEDKDSVENNTLCMMGTSVGGEEKDQVDVDRGEHKSDGSKVDGDMYHSDDQSVQKDIEEAEGTTGASPRENDIVVPCPEGVQQSEELEAPVVGQSETNTQKPERTEFRNSSLPSDTGEQEECFYDGDTDERVFRVIPDEGDTSTRRIDDDRRPDEDMALSQELGSQPSLVVSYSDTESEELGKARIESVVEKRRLSGEESPENIENRNEAVCSDTKEHSRTDSPSSICKQGSRVTDLPNTGAIARQTEEDERIQVIPQDRSQHPNRPHRAPTFSESSISDQSDSESSTTPQAGNPVMGAWSPRGVVPAFTADSQQLYCFSQVYDPITKEGAESLQDSQPKSKAFQMVENMDNGFSPEMVVAIIATRRDESSKDFINQIGNESLLMREASCIKRLCKACFRLR